MGKVLVQAKERPPARLAIAGALAIVAVALAVVGTLGFSALANAAQAQYAPTNTAPPTINDTTPEEGQTLTASPGTWTGDQPMVFTYQWERCNPAGQNCVAIPNATNQNYTVQPGDVGNTLRVTVTATNASGTRSASSAVTARVAQRGAPPPATGCSANAPLQVGNISSPERLEVNQGDITPNVVTRSTQTIVLRYRVTCRGKAVQGALVYATAVPFNQFTNSAEQPTGADGVATLTMRQLSGFPAARRQQLLTVFVRARKPGEPLLGGISTRRLVAYPVDLRR